MGTVCCQGESEVYKKKIQIVEVVQPTLPAKVDSAVKKGGPEELAPTLSTREPRVDAGKPKRSPDDFQAISYLGRGLYGKVMLAEEKTTKRRFAMKVIDKCNIKEVNLIQSSLVEEVERLDEFGFLTRIYETFQNDLRIYIMMEYHPKGDLYFYLKKRSFRCDESVLASLIAELVVALELLHRANIIYRELKPENILLTNEGHIKLTDYGLSKLLQNRELASTFEGTREYVAPEVYTGAYGRPSDIWSLGVLIFELLFEDNPLGEESAILETQVVPNCPPDVQPLIEAFLNNNISRISRQLRDLLSGMLQQDPARRLVFEQIKKHPFFSETDWEAVATRRNSPPLGSLVQNNQDILYRDVLSEQYLRRRFERCPKPNSKFQVTLHEFRNSH